MAPKRPSAKKRKVGPVRPTPTSKDNFLSKLAMLRNFVDSAQYDETDLSSCLRQCGCNVELAAERLVTGQYQRGTTKVRGKSSFFRMSTSSPSRQQNKRPTLFATPSVPTLAKKSKKGPAPSTSEKKSASMSVSGRRSTLKPTPKVSPSPGTKLPATEPLVPNRYLLCHRWIVATNTTVRHGSTVHKEPLVLTGGAPLVRFKGRNVEGTLPPNLCSILAPLSDHLSMEAEAMMGDNAIPIGGEVPMSLSIFFDRPEAFFAVFSEVAASTSPTSSKAAFFVDKASTSKRKNVKNLAAVEAAFKLLQWAEYGDVVEFKPSSEEPSDADNEEGELLTEDQLNTEVNDVDDKNKPWKDALGDAQENLPEASDPAGLAEGVVLRPYQRQALAWMMRRETQPDQRQELEKELELLAELAATSSCRSHRRLRTNLNSDPDQEVMCECGPILVTEAGASKSKTLDGVVNPVNHPLWQRRYLASPDMKTTISFYVNEVLGIATAKAPNPPRHCIGGMLCDSMGLGKTVMLLSLIMKSKALTGPDSDQHGSTLVIAPLSLIAQWEEEITIKSNLTHKLYYAETATGMVGPRVFEGIDVVITTYGTIQGELHAMTRKQNASSTGLLAYNWSRVILDEAHCIKNPTTVVAKACCLLKAERRWCVTGTPIQNSLQDVYALLKFLRHEPWCEHGFWKAAISSAMYQKEVAEVKRDDPSPNGMMIALDRVRRLLAPIMLRRTKDTLKGDGTPILTLPPVETKTVQVQFSEAEREFYNSLLGKSRTVFDGFLKDGSASKSWFKIFSLLHRLRRACDHVALTVKTQLDDTNNTLDHALATSTKKKSGSTSKTAAEKNDGVNDDFISGLLAKFRKHDESMGDGDGNKDTFTTKVAETVAKAIKSQAEAIEEECPICLEHPAIHDAVITPCGHIFCKVCLVGYLKDDVKAAKPRAGQSKFTQSCPDGKCPSCQTEIKSNTIIALFESESGKTATRYLNEKQTKRFETSKLVKPTDKANVGARQTLEDALSGAGSSKLTAVLKELNAVWEQDPGSKVLIFSQFLGFLDLVGHELQKANISHNRLDGKMRFDARVAALEQFKAKPSSDGNKGTVLLVSMRAGGVGINLVTASTVFIVDPWWNAAVEDQCINRIHRIGQTAEVVRVRKFVVQDSVEERIVQLQARKSDMATQILSATGDIDMQSGGSRPTLDDLKLLFGN